MSDRTLHVDLANAIGLTEREQMINWAMLFVRANQIEGNYMEFGVGSGRTFLNALLTAEKHRIDKMKFLGFDSFEGLPEPQGIDKDGVFSKGDYSYAMSEVQKLIPERFKDRILLRCCWFEDLAKEEPLMFCAIAWIDCDYYYSTIPVLEYLDKCMVSGSIVIFDDWNTFRGDPYRGEQLAFNKFLKRKYWKAFEFRRFSWHGNSFIMKKVIP